MIDHLKAKKSFDSNRMSVDSWTGGEPTAVGASGRQLW